MDATRRSFLLLAAAAAAGGLLAWPATALRLENVDRGAVVRYAVGPGDRFAVTSIHSIYRQPVTEEFAVGREGEIVLTGVRSASGAVLEYFGFADSRPFHPMNRPMRTIVFRVAAGDAQELSIAGRRVPFLALGDHGDRIAVRLATVPMAARIADRAAGWLAPR